MTTTKDGDKMNSGLTEEGGKTIRTFMDVLKQEPISLALVVMNIALLIIFYIVIQAAGTTRAREVAMIYENEKRNSELLAKCIDPETLRQLIDQIRKSSKAGQNNNFAETADDIKL